ncbi:cupin domain-containing protein [Klebsiella pneumoniae]
MREILISESAWEEMTCLFAPSLFLVVSGRLRMGLRTGDIILDAGEFIIVPKGTEHCPEALTEECCVVLLEPKSTLNTGNIVNERTVHELAKL